MPVPVRQTSLPRDRRTELGGDDELLPAVDLDGLPHELLVREQLSVGALRLVDPGGVEEVHSELQGLGDRLQTLLLTGPVVEARVEGRHAHASETHGRHLQALAAELASLHAASKLIGIQNRREKSEERETKGNPTRNPLSVTRYLQPVTRYPQPTGH